MHASMKRHATTGGDRQRQTPTDTDRHRHSPQTVNRVYRQSTGSTGSQQGPQTANRVHRRRQTPSVDELGVSPMAYASELTESGIEI
jgi:hypothetical protein